jgi:hypothetical protein
MRNLYEIFGLKTFREEGNIKMDLTRNRAWNGFHWLRMACNGDFYEHDNESSCSIKYG